MTNRVPIGSIRAPSGIVVVLDAGYAGLWCHTAEDFSDDSGWPFDADLCQAMKASPDVRIIGPDAAEAGRLLARQWHPLWLYDFPKHLISSVEQELRGLTTKHALQASLVASERRIPHPQRTAHALTHGNGAGEIQLFGVPAAVCSGLPTDRECAVFAEGDDRRRVVVEVRPDAAATSSHVIGHCGVDWARIMFADVEALGAWEHEKPLDGQADFAFWGRDGHLLAEALGVPALDKNSFGWRNLPIAEAFERGLKAERMRDARGWHLGTDFRPHSHHWQLMEQVRASPLQSGTVAIGDAKLCGFMTPGGDGIFDVVAERDAAGNLVRLAVDFGA